MIELDHKKKQVENERLTMDLAGGIVKISFYILWHLLI